MTGAETDFIAIGRGKQSIFQGSSTRSDKEDYRQENVTIQSAATVKQCSQHQQPQSAVTSMDTMDEALCVLSPEAERNLGVAVRKDF